MDTVQHNVGIMNYPRPLENNYFNYCSDNVTLRIKDKEDKHVMYDHRNQLPLDSYLDILGCKGKFVITFE